MANKKSKKKNNKLKINVIDGSFNQKSSRKKSQGIINKLNIEEKIDLMIKGNCQVDIIAVFNELFKFDTVSADDLTIYEKMSIGHQTESGKIPRMYVLKSTDGVDAQVNKAMKDYLCSHRIIIGDGNKKFVKHMAYPISSDDPAYDVYKSSMIPYGWKLGRCAICEKIELIKDENVDEADRANISDIIMQASLGIETIKSLYATSIHNEIAAINEEDDDSKAQIIKQLQILRQFSGQLAYNLGEIAKDLDKGISIEEKNNEDTKGNDIMSSYGVDVNSIFDKKKNN